MIIDTDKLITVRNFALKNGVSATTVYKWIESGREKCVNIDGMKFVILKNEE